MVIMPDVRGLHAYYCALAHSFAEAGFETIAFDYFGRSAGLVDGREEGFDYMPLVRQLDLDQVAEDAGAAIRELGGSADRVFTIGFCLGGALSWRQSADQPGLAGAIGFYGIPGRARDTVARMKAPLLMLLGGDDRATTPDDFEKFETELDDAGVDHRAITYPGAPHSFFDRTYAQHVEACTDSWKQIFDFTGVPA
jgi:carboxymethylenebutenolidase